MEISRAGSVDGLSLEIQKQIADTVTDATIQALFSRGWTSFRTLIWKDPPTDWKIRINIVVTKHEDTVSRLIGASR